MFVCMVSHKGICWPFLCGDHICIQIHLYHSKRIYSKLVCGARTRTREIYLSTMFHEYIGTPCLTQGEYICILQVFTRPGLTERATHSVKVVN